MNKKKVKLGVLVAICCLFSFKGFAMDEVQKKYFQEQMLTPNRSMVIREREKWEHGENLFNTLYEDDMNANNNSCEEKNETEVDAESFRAGRLMYNNHNKKGSCNTEYVPTKKE